MTTGFKHNRQGFTLIEVLVTLCILGIALTAVLKSALLLQEGLQKSKQQTQAAQVANLLLTEITAKDYDLLNFYQGETDEFPGWTWRANIYSTPEEEIKKLTLQIFAPDGILALTMTQLFLVNSKGK